MGVADAWSPARDVALSVFTTLGVGGPARWFSTAASADDVARAHRWAQANGVPLMLLGGGSNLVIADRGVDALVLRMEIRGVASRVAETGEAGGVTLEAGAGESWDGLVARACAQGLAGVESLSGIPGSVGGTPIQNVGAYGQDVGQTIESVTVFDRTRDEVGVLTAAECGFGYRMSRFKAADAQRFIVCGVTFRLRHVPPVVRYPDLQAELDRAASGAPPSVLDVRDAVLRVRRRKGMVVDAADADTRSVGSFFTNPIVTREVCERIATAAGKVPPQFNADHGTVKIPAAWLIERAGFQRGHMDGPAGISTKHTLALVNRGGAAAADIVRLAVAIKTRVADRFGVSLLPEPMLVGFEDDPLAAALRG